MQVQSAERLARNKSFARHERRRIFRRYRSDESKHVSHESRKNEFQEADSIRESNLRETILPLLLLSYMLVLWNISATRHGVRLAARWTGGGTSQ